MSVGNQLKRSAKSNNKHGNQDLNTFYDLFRHSLFLRFTLNFGHLFFTPRTVSIRYKRSSFLER